jgi:hypothetical protein
MTLDVICAIDPRFVGGTAAALASDIQAFLDAGLEVGLLEVTSPYLQGNPKIRSKIVTEIVDDTRLHLFDAAQSPTIKAKTAFLHHPMTFFYGLDDALKLDVERSYLVAHHLPFRGDGSLQYDPIITSKRVLRSVGTRPLWAPVSGICRQQLQSFTPFIQLANQDWPNVFDVDEWVPSRQSFSDEHLTIGRHGRADLLKWPETRAMIQASLPSLPQTDIRVMGAPLEGFSQMGVDTSGWTILPFDAEPVVTFLDRLDVFIYHFHTQSSESFGRTVAEAMLMGSVCILDPRLEPTFGDLAIYGEPNETSEHIERLRANPVASRKFAERAKATIAARHSLASVSARLDELNFDKPAPRYGLTRTASPLDVIRKTVGMIRRREYFLSQLGKRL